jgi:TolB-like protein
VPPQIEPPATTVSAHLDRLLESPRLRASPRLRRFLRFVVEEALAGRADELNQYRIAIDVFERGDHFDPRTDPTVRVEAGKLRVALEHYYLSPESSDSVCIEIPKGSYAPVIRYRRPVAGPARAERRPTLLVPPIHNLDGGGELSVFGEILSEELVVALASCPKIRVVRETATRAETGGHRLFGTLRRNGAALRLTFRVEDLESSVQCWADTLDVPLDAADAGAISREVAVRVGDIDGVLVRREMLRETPDPDGDTYEASIRFHAYMRSFSSDDYWQARRAIEAAVASNPESAELSAMLADCSRGGVLHGFDTDPLLLERGQLLSRRSVNLDRRCAVARLSLGYSHLAEGRTGAAIRQAETVLELPSMSARGDAGLLLTLAGDSARGIDAVRNCVDTLDAFPGWYRHAFFLKAFLAGDFEGALEEAMQIGMPHLPWDAIDRAAALAMLGELDAARSALSELLVLRPDFERESRRYVEGFHPQPEIAGALLSSLTKAGLGFALD